MSLYAGIQRERGRQRETDSSYEEEDTCVRQMERQRNETEVRKQIYRYTYSHIYTSMQIT